MRRRLLSCAFLLSACGGSSKPAEAPPPAPTPTAAEVQASRCRGFMDKLVLVYGDDDMFAKLPADKRTALVTRFVDGMVAACVEDAWPDDILTCGEKADTRQALGPCGKLLDRERVEKSAKRLEPVMKDIKAATPAEPEPEPEAEAGAEPEHPGDASVSQGVSSVASCDAYIATFEVYMSCDEVPQQARAASKESLEAMKSGWAQFKDPSVPAEARQAAADACFQGREALVQSAQALGCDLEAKAAEPAKPAKGKKPAKKAKPKK